MAYYGQWGQLSPSIVGLVDWLIDLQYSVWMTVPDLPSGRPGARATVGGLFFLPNKTDDLFCRQHIIVIFLVCSGGGPLLVGGLGPGPHGPPVNPALMRLISFQSLTVSMSE